MANPFPFASGDVLTAADLNSIGEPTTFTPNFVTGLTVGSGIFSSLYLQVNEIVLVSVFFELASNSAVTGDLRMDLPIQSSSTWYPAANLSGGAWDSTAGQFFPLMGRPYNSAQTRVMAIDTAGAYAENQFIAASVPFSWGTGDKLVFGTWYVKA